VRHRVAAGELHRADLPAEEQAVIPNWVVGAASASLALFCVVVGKPQHAAGEVCFFLLALLFELRDRRRGAP
jgi:hypothetical protein